MTRPLRSLALGLLALALAAPQALATEAGAGTAAKGRLPRILESGELRVGLSGNQPPLNMKNKQGELIGLEVDLVNALAESMGLKTKLVAMPFAELLPALEKGEVDMVISGMTITPERNARVPFAGPYFISGKSVLTKSETIANVQDTAALDDPSRSFAALAGSTSEKFVKEMLPSSKLVATKDYDAAVQMVIDDEVDGLVADFPICALSVARNPEANLSALMTPLTVEPLGIALPPDSPLLVNLVENYLDTLEYTGLLMSFKARWLSDTSWISELPEAGIDMQRFLLCIVLVALAGLLLMPACSSSPKSGDKPRRTILATEYDDAQVGEESSMAVAAQMGVLDDAALNAYVSNIGRKLLRGIPRRSFNYQFSVVDQIEPNAFALPGGYVYISRGLLALANNEDELACVIGHEITHAAHRHAALQQQMSKRLNPLSMGWKRAATLSSYGRDMERDADQGGQMLCAAAGYDPMGMSTFLDALGQWERYRVGYTRNPSFFDTHPGSQERAAVNAIRAHELRWKRDSSIGEPRAALLKHTEGMPVGERPEAGLFEGDRFLHPDLDFTLRFPPGWRLSNSNQAVGAMSPKGDAVVFLMADMPAGEPKTMAQTWVEKTSEQQKIKVKESKPVKIGDIPAWRMRIDQSGRGGSITSFVTFIPYGGATWRITGASPASLAKSYLGRTLATTRSFRPLTEEEKRSLFETHLHVVEARRGEDLLSLGERTNNAWNPTSTAIHNGVFSDHRYQGGELVKVAVSEPYVPKSQEPPAQ